MHKGSRRSPRQPMFKVIRYSIQGREYVDLSTNISHHGIFIKTITPPPLGTDVRMTVKLPDEWGNLPLHILGRVMHVNDGEDEHKRGMGVEFHAIQSDSVPIIEYFVHQIYDNDLNTDRLSQPPENAPEASLGAYIYQVEDPSQKS